MPNDFPIHMILTGGTISKTYNPATEKPEMDEAPIVRDYITEIIRPHRNITSERVCLKDSMDLTDDDRKNITAAISNASVKHILVIHGTSTMEVTAEYLKEQLGPIDKTIVITGAMIPLKEFAMSDAGFNLGYALAQAQALEPGIYVCMNAHTFKAGSVTKNHAEARFEAV